MYLYYMKVIINESQYRTILESLQFDNVYKMTYPKVFETICMRYAKGDYDTAMEYCQLGYIKVNEKLNTVKDEEKVEGWVAMVVRNTIINEMRRRQLDTIKDFDFDRSDIADSEYDPNPDFFDGKLTASQIRYAINQLPEGYKNVIKLRYFDELSHDEIAKQLGITSATSRTQLRKATQKLNDMLKKFKQ